MERKFWIQVGTVNNVITLRFLTGILLQVEPSLAGGNTAYRIASWNGTSWSALGSGLDASVFCETI
jgi:hypothetical protein